MDYVQPLGDVPNASYINGDLSQGIEGSIVDGAAIEAVQREIVEVITSAGLVADGADNTQLRQAITAMVASASKSVLISSATFEGTVVDKDAVRWDSGAGNFVKAIADGTANGHAVGFADVTNSQVISFGDSGALFAGLTPGARYYLDGVTPGAITTTPPADIVKLGIAKSANTLFVDVDAGAAVVAQTGLVQRVLQENRTHSSVSSGFPQDDTIPQITEGVELLSAQITPQSATNILRISASMGIGMCSATGQSALALFQDGAADAIEAVLGPMEGASGGGTTNFLLHETVAGGTGPITFTLRAGANGSTLYINGSAVFRRFGGVSKTFLLIEEFVL